MAITNGQTASASDFVSASSGASDSGKVAKLDSAGQLLRAFVKNPVRGVGSASKNLADADGATQTIAHGLGVAPTRIRMWTTWVNSTDGSGFSDGTWITGGSYAHALLNIIEGASVAAADNAEQNTDRILNIRPDRQGVSGNFQYATVAVDATNITLTWHKTGSPTGTFSFLWEAEGYS